MRPTVFGRQIAYRGNEFIGLSLGYNYYCEHEGSNEVYGLLQGINNSFSNAKEIAECRNVFKLRSMSKKVNRWRSTPYRSSIIRPNKSIYVKRITIDNSDVKEYSSFLTENGKYTLILIPTDFATIEYFDKKLGTRRKFSEPELFCMEDYQHVSSSSSGMVIRGYLYDNTQKPNELCGNWGSDGIMILVKNDGKYHDIDEQIVKAIHNGNMALVYEEQRLFKDGRCCLINLEALYRPR